MSSASATRVTFRHGRLSRRCGLVRRAALEEAVREKYIYAKRENVYLHRISGENFRVFGSKESGTDLQLEFASGLNVLVGENDAGKTSVIDAIRHVLLTTSYEFLRIQEHDFHIEGDTRAKTLWLAAEFRGLSKEQRATVVEWLT